MAAAAEVTDVIKYKPVGFFWNLDSCPMPDNMPAKDVIIHLRRFFVQYRNCHKEMEFVIVCDVTKLHPDVCKEITTEGVILAHARSDAKKSSDKILASHFEKFISSHGNSLPSVVFISGRSDICSNIRSCLLEGKCTVILLHPDECPEKLKIGWTEAYPMQVICAAVEQKPVQERNRNRSFFRIDRQSQEMYNQAEAVVDKPKREPTRGRENVNRQEDHQWAQRPRSFAKREQEHEKHEVVSEQATPRERNARTKQEYQDWFICVHPCCYVFQRKGTRRAFRTYEKCLNHIQKSHTQTFGFLNRPDWIPRAFIKRYSNTSKKRCCCAYPSCHQDEYNWPIKSFSPHMTQFATKMGFYEHFRKFHHSNYKPRVFGFVIQEIMN